jgi:hypothetical protein
MPSHPYFVGNGIKALFGFLMACVLFAERAVFVQFNPVRSGPFILIGNIVPPFAFATSHGNFHTH